MRQKGKGPSGFKKKPVSLTSPANGFDFRTLFTCSLLIALLSSGVLGQPEARLGRSSNLEKSLPPGASHQYALRLTRGESAEIVVGQQGVDVVVEVRSPGGKLIDEVDGPTGRRGDEVVEIIADEDGEYLIRVKPFDANEPVGNYRLQVKALRGVQETTELLRNRRQVRLAATQWLRPFSMAIPNTGILPTSQTSARWARLTSRARVVGIGEATHGSREFADFRLSFTKYLIEQQGFRTVAIEASASGLQLLEPYLNGQSALTPAVTQVIESGWIGRRSRREIVRWIQRWNKTHPGDRVRVVGVDAQENSPARATLRAFIGRAYGESVLKRWEPVERELAAADEQTAVFGDSTVDLSARQVLVEVSAMLNLDAPLLKKRFGTTAVNSAIEAAQILTEFADFNSGSGGTINHSRDWYMAARVLRVLDQGGPTTKVVYWAHNAHVAHPPASERTSGSLLKTALGCEYRALALTFGEGSFVAQRPNDPEDRLEVSTVAKAPDESIESMLSELHPGTGALAAWPCSSAPGPSNLIASSPAWLKERRLMHWVGALFTPGSLPSTAFRPFDLLNDFDGILYLPRVTADELPKDRPLIPARKR